MRLTNRLHRPALSVMPLLLLLLSGCTSTLVATQTQQWHVPAVNQKQRATETADLAAAQNSLSNWCRTEATLPVTSDSSRLTCDPVSGTVTH